MIDLTNAEDVRMLQSNIRASIGTPQGQEVMKFLEDICGWYDFTDTNPDIILIRHGKRQVLATIKTLLDLNTDQIVAFAKQKEQLNG